MAMGTTVDDLCERVRRDSLLGTRGPTLTLNTALTDTTTTDVVTNETPEHLGVGSVISMDTEMMYVTAVSTSTKTITVLRGYQSTAASHTTGTIIEVDALTPKAAIIEWVEQEIRSWGSEIWRETEADDIAIAPSTARYDLAGVTGEVYFLLDVRLKPDSSSVYSLDRWPRVKADLIRNAETTSGFALQIHRVPRNGTGDLRVVVAQPLDLSSFTLSTDLVSTVGVPVSAMDVVEFGTRWRALSASGMARTNWRAAGHARDAEEVNPTDLLRAVSMAKEMRDLRFTQQALEQRERWPYRSR